MRDGYACSVPDFIRILGGGQVDKKLGQLKGKGNEGDLFERDLVELLKGQKEQRSKISGNGLSHKTEVASNQGFLVILFLYHVARYDKRNYLKCKGVFLRGDYIKL